MSVISTYASSVNIAKSYINKELWVVLAGSTITWADEANPPKPSPSISKFSDLRGLLYVDIKRLVIKNIAGSIKTQNHSYIYIDNNLSTEYIAKREGYYLYTEATLPYNSNLVGESFRLIGLAENVVTTNTSPRAKGLFIEAELITGYDLILIDAISPLTITESEHKFQFVRRF